MPLVTGGAGSRSGRGRDRCRRSRGGRASVGVGFSAVFAAAGQWVASGAVWLLGQVGQAMSATTTVDLDVGMVRRPTSRSWRRYGRRSSSPWCCCATIQALYRQSAAMLVRTFLVQLPLALLLTGVAVELVQMALAVTDALSAQVLAERRAWTPPTSWPPCRASWSGPGPPTPASPPSWSSSAASWSALAALGLWLELVVRAAAVSVAVLFLPLALAALVWPAVSHWCRRLADTLVALILSKLVIAAVLSLAVGALAGGLGVGATRRRRRAVSPPSSPASPCWSSPPLSPFTLLRLIPAVEAGAISHLESTRHRLASAAKAPLQAGMDVASTSAAGRRGASAAGDAAGAGPPVSCGRAAIPMAETASVGQRPRTRSAGDAAIRPGSGRRRRRRASSPARDAPASLPLRRRARGHGTPPTLLAIDRTGDRATPDRRRGG